MKRKLLLAVITVIVASGHGMGQNWMKIDCDSKDVQGIPFQKVRIKKGETKELIFTKDYQVTLSEKPDGIESGYYIVHARNGYIADGDKKNKIEIGDERMTRQDGGWYEYDFGKTLYIRKIGIFVGRQEISGPSTPIYILPINDSNAGNNAKMESINESNGNLQTEETPKSENADTTGETLEPEVGKIVKEKELSIEQIKKIIPLLGTLDLDRLGFKKESTSTINGLKCDHYVHDELGKRRIFWKDNGDYMVFDEDPDGMNRAPKQTTKSSYEYRITMPSGIVVTDHSIDFLNGYRIVYESKVSLYYPFSEFEKDVPNREPLSSHFARYSINNNSCLILPDSIEKYYPIYVADDDRLVKEWGIWAPYNSENTAYILIGDRFYYLEKEKGNLKLLHAGLLFENRFIWACETDTVIGLKEKEYQYEISYKNGDKVSGSGKSIRAATLHRKIGVVSINPESGKTVIRYADGRIFSGDLKYDFNFVSLHDDDLIPWKGDLQLADGTITVLNEGKTFEDQVAENEDKAQSMLKARKAGDMAYAKLETVKDLSSMINNNNLINELNKLKLGQNSIQGNFRIRIPITAISISDNAGPVDPQKSFVTIESIDFGKMGKTILFNLDLPDMGIHNTYTISGKNASVLQGKDGDSDIILAILKGKSVFASAGRCKQKWVSMINNIPGVVNDFYRGMTRSEVEAVCGQLGLSKFKETGKTAKYTICTLYWLDLQKMYNIFGNYNYQMSNDKRYGEFYFNSEGKLMKWILFM